MPQQHIHRYAIVEELGSLNGAKLYSATRPGSPAPWTLLNWTPASCTVEAQSAFLQETRSWSEDGVESFVYKGDFCLASQSRTQLETKAALLGQVAPASNHVATAPNAAASNGASTPAPVKTKAEEPPAARPEKLLEDVGMVQAAMESWGQIAPQAADRDLLGDAGELWQLGEEVKTSRTVDRAHLETFARCAGNIAAKIVYAADTTIDPGRQNPEVQNAVTQATFAAGLALVDPPLGSNPEDTGAFVLPDAVRGNKGGGGGGVAVVECRGLRDGADMIQAPRVRVWESSAKPVAKKDRRTEEDPNKGRAPVHPDPPRDVPESHTIVRSADTPVEPVADRNEPVADEKPKTPSKPKSSLFKWLTLAGLVIALGGSAFYAKSYFGHSSEGTIVDPIANPDPETAVFRDPNSHAGFTYPRASLQKVTLEKTNELIRLKSADGIIVSLTIDAVPGEDPAEALAAAHRADLAVPGRDVKHQSAISSEEYVISGSDGSVLFLRKVLNPKGYIAAMTISHNQDLHPSINPASMILTFKIMDAKL